MVTAVALSC